MKEEIAQVKYKTLKKDFDNLLDTLKDREEYIKHLEELCDKYEKEHETTFQLWVKQLNKNKEQE